MEFMIEAVESTKAASLTNRPVARIITIPFFFLNLSLLYTILRLDSIVNKKHFYNSFLKCPSLEKSHQHSHDATIFVLF